MSMYLEENSHQSIWYKAGEISGFLQRVSLQKLQNLQGNYDIKQCLQLQSSVSGKKC